MLFELRGELGDGRVAGLQELHDVAEAERLRDRDVDGDFHDQKPVTVRIVLPSTTFVVDRKPLALAFALRASSE